MTRQFKRLTHSIYECKYHVVFCPKYRYQILRDEVAEYARQQIYWLSQQKDGVGSHYRALPFQTGVPAPG